AETYPARIPDLYLGEPLLLAAELTAVKGTATTGGRMAGKSWRRQLALKTPTEAPGIASVAARAKTGDLLVSRNAGAAEEKVRSAVLQVALAHGLVSPYTAFIAVDKTPRQATAQAPRTVPIPTARPAGQSNPPYAWPRTATPGRW